MSTRTRPFVLLASVCVAALAAGLTGPARAASAEELTPQEITFEGMTDQWFGAFNELAASASSGLPVSFATTAACHVRTDGDQPAVIAVTLGTCTVTASQAGNDEWQAAADVVRSFDFVQAEAGMNAGLQGGWVHAPGEELTVMVEVGGIEGNEPAPRGNVTVHLMGDDVPQDMRTLGTVALDAEGLGELTVAGSQTRRLGKGHYGISAVYAGSDEYTRAFSEFYPLELFSPTQTTLNVKPVKSRHGDAVLLTAVVRDADGDPLANTDGIVDFQWSSMEGFSADLGDDGVATLTTTELPGGKDYKLMAQFMGNAEYGTSWDITVITVTPEDQTITFPPLADSGVGASALLKATATSGLPVRYGSSTPQVCDVADDADTRRWVVTTMAVGTCTIVAAQPGDRSYSAADPVRRSFAVGGTPKPHPADVAPAAGPSAVTAAGPSGGLVAASPVVADRGPIVNVRRPVTKRYALAPTATIRVKDTARIQVRGLPAGSLNLVRVRMGNAWVTLGKVRADASGRVLLPVVTAQKVGTYPLRLVPEGQAPRYLRLVVKAR